MQPRLIFQISIKLLYSHHPIRSGILQQADFIQQDLNKLKTKEMMETYLGIIKLFPYNFAPMGWILCNGATLQITQNQALYSLIGIKFGGNGSTTFQVPNLTNAAPTSPGASVQTMAYYIASVGIYPQRP